METQYAVFSSPSDGWDSTIDIGLRMKRSSA